METEPRSPNQSGLRAHCLPFSEILAQSIANVAPTAMPAIAVALVYGIAGNGTWFTYVLATTGLVFVGLNINQFARRSASPGSLYAYITKGLGATPGVIAGWALILAYLFTAMTVACGFVNFAEVLLTPLGLSLSPFFLVAICVGVSWYCAYRDIQLSAMLMLAIEVASVGMILLLGAIVLFKSGTAIDPAQLTLQDTKPGSITFSLVLGVLSFVGFESATTLGDEAKNPLRTIPRAVLLSTIASGSFFIAMTYIVVLGFSKLSQPLTESTAPLNDLAQATGVGFFGVLISICALVSMFACTLACINAGSRILFTMGRHRIFHRSLGRVHGRNETPHVAVTIASLITFLATAVVLLKVSVLDAFAYFGTIATFGFLTVYILISIAAPCYLARLGRLRARHLLFSILAIGFMLIPVVGSVGIPGEGSLFPVPPAPYSLFPYLYLLYLAVGTGWFVWLRRRSPQLIRNIEADIEAAHLKFGDMHKI